MRKIMKRENLKKQIQNKTAKLAVIGLGYVGLPLAVNFAKAGFSVWGLDKDEDRVIQLQQRRSYILDMPAKEVAEVIDQARFSPGMDFAVLAQVDVIIVCVPTPLKRKYTPDISYIVDAVKTIRRYIRPGTLVVLESTTYPGTTDELFRPELERGGRKAGTDFYLAFSPERIDPGNKNYDVTRIPKLVGGVTAECGELTKLLYEKIIVAVHLVSSAKAAEMTKLLENSFRIINIGWINEVARMCHKMGVDVWEVIAAAKTKPFGFMPFYPGLGVGGHCIPDDPLYLYWKAKKYGFHSKYIKLSADTNADMPAYAVERITEILKPDTFLQEASLLVLGVAYKKDVKDLRRSPSLVLIELLQKAGARVDYSDPLIPYLKINGIDLLRVEVTPANLRKYDCVVIATDHSQVDYAAVRKHSRLVFDVKNVYGDKMYKNVVRL
ncbi:MAG: nucleotide sugar dehydrogenase [Candidatus Omnitrophica bacterium]|nr:nucleotide sugar dehydrogenase [Candidatus Omnitrophota bacterium]